MKTTPLVHPCLRLITARCLATLAVASLSLSVTLAAPASTQSRRPQKLAAPDNVPDGLKPSDWAAIRQQYEEHRHAAVPVDGGYQARNAGQQWQTHFDGRGFTTKPDTGSWQWGLELRSYGFSGNERVIAAESKSERVGTQGQRVTYDWDNILQEWFVNDSRGLEHGFTIRERPPGAGEKLALNLAVRGSLRHEVQTNGHGIRFMDAHGNVVLTYAGLTVFDADGRTLPTCFEPIAEGLRLVIDECGVRYPLTIDPLAQQAYIKASNTGANDYFGQSVAISGDTVVIGAWAEDSNATSVNGNQSDNSAADSGAAYIFVRNGTTWIQQAYLKASNAGAGSGFGSSVAVSGDTIAIGAPGEDSIAGDSGAVYIFLRNGTSWSEQALLKASNTGGSDGFGHSVAVSGNTVLVGAAYEDSNATGVNGDQSDNSATAAGAAYVFVRTGTAWSQQAYLKASNTGPNDWFGSSVAVSGETAVIAAYQEDSNSTVVNGSQSDNSATDSGAAYIFVRNGAMWHQQAYLKASNTGTNDYFGCSVAVSGDTVAVGAYGEDSNSTGVNGNQSDNSATDSGAVYVFVRNGTTWNQQAYLKASNAAAGDYFGRSAAAADDALLVGADGEDSNATDVNGNQNNNSAFSSGAAYVFVRTGTTWSQDAYLKASNTGSLDLFGRSVAISGDSTVIGAFWEDSNAIGVDGNQSDESASASGAAYVFTGILPAPEIAVESDPTELIDAWSVVDFVSVQLGGMNQRTFTIRNLGYADLTGLNISITGENASDFTVSANPATTLAAGGYTTFSVRFSAGATGDRSASLHISSNDSDESPFDITLTGTGITPLQKASALEFTSASPVPINGAGNPSPIPSTITVSGINSPAFVRVRLNALEYTYREHLDIFLMSPSGQVCVLMSDVGGPYPRSLVVYDSIMFYDFAGTAAPDNTQIVEGTYRPANYGEIESLPPGGTGVLGTSLNALGTGVINGDWKLFVTDDNGDFIYGSLSSWSLVFDEAGLEPSPAIAVEQRPAVGFANGSTIGFGETNELTFTIKNFGSADLTGLGTTIVGADATMFTVVASPTVPVVPGGSTVFTVRFTPTSAGAKTAMLHISNNDLDDNPFSISLVGMFAHEAWVRRFDQDDDRANAVTVDGNGDVVVTGISGYRYYTAKYSGADGTLLWENRSPSFPLTGSALAVAADSNGDVAVTGTYSTVKYAASDGSLLWERSGSAKALVMDGSGNVIVTGVSATIKYAAVDGALLWAHNGSADAVVVDSSGNVLVTGHSGDDLPNFDYRTAKYAAANGELLWEKYYNGPGNFGDYATALAVDAGGNVVVTGTSWGSSEDFYTAKYAAIDGALLWEKRFNGIGSYSNDRAMAVAVDSTGNVVVTGSTSHRPFGAPGWEMYTAKYAAADGARLWERRYKGPADIDIGHAVAIDIGDNVVVMGYSGAASISRFDFYTAKYRTTDGALLWEKRYDGPGHRDDWSLFDIPSRTLALGPNGTIAITGWSDGAFDPDPINYDYATIVYREDFPPSVVSVERVALGVRLYFKGIPGLSYRLQRAVGVTGPWATIDTQTAPASGLIEYHETNPPPSAAFYRTVTP